MPITTVEKDPENLTMTVVADFKASLQRLWDAYTDPRQIEKFWGPPTFPATFTRHDVFPGGRSNYSMTGPDGSVHGGYWEWIDVKHPEGDSASFEVRDGFSTPDGSPNTDLPTMRMVFHFESTVPAGSRVTTTTFFNTSEQLAQLVEMGMEEGMREAMSQIDDVLADLTSFALGMGTNVDVLADTRFRISRVIRGTVEQVWRAHTEPELMKRWLTGPDGWVMTECNFPLEIGASYHFSWAQEDGPPEQFGFGGEVVEVEPGHRLVTTERMFGDDGPEATQEVTLTPVEGGTLLSQVMTYPDVAACTQALESGMVDGCEASYARLETLIT